MPKSWSLNSVLMKSPAIVLYLKLSCSLLVSGNAECFGVIQWNMYQLFYRGWQVCQYIPTTRYIIGLYENKTQSHLLVLELVHYQRMRSVHSWSTGLGMTSHTDMSRSYELLHQTSSDGTVPGPLNCISRTWFWNRDRKLNCIWVLREIILNGSLYSTKSKNVVLV